MRLLEISRGQPEHRSAPGGKRGHSVETLGMGGVGFESPLPGFTSLGMSGIDSGDGVAIG
jgi:hypothetical protein